MEEKGVDLRCSNFHVKVCLELYLMAGECFVTYNSAFNTSTTALSVPALAGAVPKLARAGA
ncbi:hypothetical protein N0V85_007469 [Neurospora sp. IMI 360204]|nr:hypothetical protein N0V85_007469 [Neurospora sp. IMI 360204]